MRPEATRRVLCTLLAAWLAGAPYINARAQEAASEAAGAPYVACEGEGHCVAVLAEGQPAPFDGQLLSPEAAVGLRLRILTATTSAEARLERATRLHEEEVRYQDRVHDIEIESAEARREIWENEARRAHAKLDSIWRHPALWFGFGVLAATALAVGVGAAAGAVR